MTSLIEKSKSYKKLKKILDVMIKDSGGSIDKVNLRRYIDDITNAFTSPSYDYWLGVNILKNPSELIILQEIMFEKRPDTIIECGTFLGGSSFFMATLMDLMRIEGKIITIDKNSFPPQPYPRRDVVNFDGKTKLLDYDMYVSSTHPKIEYIHSDCLTAKIPKLKGNTMVILDCDHTAPHVYQELIKFSKFVSLNQYIIVEDTNMYERNGRGPAKAIEKFLRQDKNFIIDTSREKYGTQTSIGGYLLRVA